MRISALRNQVVDLLQALLDLIERTPARFAISTAGIEHGHCPSGIGAIVGEPIERLTARGHTRATFRR